MSNEVIKTLEYLCDKVGIVIDWTSSSIVPYIEQLGDKLIAWETCTSCAWIAFMLVVVGIFLFLAIKFDDGDDGDGDDGDCCAWVTFSLVSATALIVIMVQVFDIIECKTFPEKTIYEYIKMYIH